MFFLVDGHPRPSLDNHFIHHPQDAQARQERESERERERREREKEKKTFMQLKVQKMQKSECEKMQKPF